MAQFAAFLDLTTTHFLISVVVVFAAGMVRGFSGFALSALVMASLALIIPPVELIPVCWIMEFSATVLMVRGGFRDADRSMVLGLVAGSICGLPLGLYLTNSWPVDVSKTVALAVILVLAVLQLLKVRATFLATKPGVVAAGAMAGVATGLASVGGMVVALYVLARDAAPRSMRGSLVAYLGLNSFFGFVYLYLYGMLNSASLSRGLVFAPVVMLGVLVGQRLFRPSLEGYYRPFCLALLMFLAAIGLVRLGLGG